MNRFGHLLILLLLAGTALSACAAARPAQPQTPGARSGLGADIIRESTRALKEMRAATRQQILDYALEDARAVIILPGVYQAGFYYSLHGGNGVLVARDSDGNWGAPAFVGVGGAGFGMQIGLERQRLVLVVSEQETLEDILAHGLNFDILAKYDVLGVREEAERGSLTGGRPGAAFSDGVGLMAGVAMRGALLTLNESLTEAYYGQIKGGAKAVLQTKDALGLEVFELWGALSVTLPRGRNGIIRAQ
jgi:lipid-binding SYLF domain-containing protein